VPARISAPAAATRKLASRSRSRLNTSTVASRPVRRVMTWPKDSREREAGRLDAEEPERAGGTAVSGVCVDDSWGRMTATGSTEPRASLVFMDTAALLAIRAVDRRV
jgi:hypothetical protein